MAKDVDDVAAEDKALPTIEQLNGVLAFLSERKATISELSGQIGAEIKDAEENKNVHRKVIKLIAQLKKMDDTKRIEWFRHFDHYSDECALRDQVQADMFDDGIDGDDA